ncbi:MAG: DUF6702 family protein [Bacteroidota bacterium]
MKAGVFLKPLLVLLFWVFHVSADAHPLRLSLCEIEYSSGKQLLTINLKLFLMDVNEALVFDPNSNELAFCEPNESADADRLLLEYLNAFFYVTANDKRLQLQIKNKKLNGEGDNVALGVFFEYNQSEKLRSLEIKNAVFTDLFFDQSNVVYIHADGDSKSLMLNKKTTTHKLYF